MGGKENLRWEHWKFIKVNNLCFNQILYLKDGNALNVKGFILQLQICVVIALLKRLQHQALIQIINVNFMKVMGHLVFVKNVANHK